MPLYHIAYRSTFSPGLRLTPMHPEKGFVAVTRERTWPESTGWFCDQLQEGVCWMRGVLNCAYSMSHIPPTGNWPWQMARGAVLSSTTELRYYLCGEWRCSRGALSVHSNVLNTATHAQRFPVCFLILAKGSPPLFACAMRLTIVHYPFAFNGLCRFTTSFDLRYLYSPGAL